MHKNPADTVIRDLLIRSKTVAVVGLSPKPHRDSHRVAAYLQSKGYRVIPVYPREEEILGEKVYRRLEDIPLPVDIVDVFRRSEDALPIAESALALRPAALWLQVGVRNEEAAHVAKGGSIITIMDRCIMTEHRRLGL